MSRHCHPLQYMLLVLVSGQFLSNASAQVTIDANSSVTAVFSAELDPKDASNVVFGLKSISPSVSLNAQAPITIPIHFVGTASSAWGNPLNWGGYYAAVSTGSISKSISTIGSQALNIPVVWVEVEQLYNTLYNGGPTEKSVSSKLASMKWYSKRFNGVEASADISATLNVKFDVTVPSGKLATADQTPIVLQNLTNGGTLQGGSIDVREDLINTGTVSNTSAFVDGNFSNSGGFSSNLLDIENLFFNTGTLTLLDRGNLNCHTPMTNNGTIVMQGAKITGARPQQNDGVIQLDGGSNEFTVGLIDHGTIRGYGNVLFSGYGNTLEEYGMVVADSPGKQLQLDGTFSNYGVLSATSGTLKINGIVTQGSGGVINAVGTVYLPVQVEGGRLAGGALLIHHNETTSFKNLVNEGTIRVLSRNSNNAHSALTFSGSYLINNGAIIMNDDSGVYKPGIRLSNSTLLSGSGFLYLNGCEITDGGYNLTLTVDSQSSIMGAGYIYCRLVVMGQLGGLGKQLYIRDLTMTDSAKTVPTIDGLTKGQSYDSITFSNSPQLKGTLNVAVGPVGAKLVKSSDSFRVIEGSGITGGFSNVASGQRIQTSIGTCKVTVGSTGVTLSDFEGYLIWRNEMFSTGQINDDEISGDTRSPSGDGVPNLLKYAFGAAPFEALGDKAPKLIMDSGRVGMRFLKAKRASDLSYTVEESNDLNNWSPASGTSQVILDASSSQTIEFTLSGGSAAPRKFMRLKVSRK